MIKKKTLLSFPLFFFFCKVEGGGTNRLVEVVVRTCSQKETNDASPVFDFSPEPATILMINARSANHMCLGFALYARNVCSIGFSEAVKFSPTRSRRVVIAESGLLH